MKPRRRSVTEEEDRGLNKRYRPNSLHTLINTFGITITSTYTKLEIYSLKIPSRSSPTPNILRNIKEKRLGADDENILLHKAIKAMLALIVLNENEDDTIEDAICSFSINFAFPSVEVNYIKISCTYKEAVNDPQYSKQWKSVMMEELTSLISNGTWKKTILPKDANLVSFKWAFTIKQNPDGSFEHFKARLVALGFG